MLSEYAGNFHYCREVVILQTEGVIESCFLGARVLCPGVFHSGEKSTT